jgi:branched-chain amino acid aminotransferase/4-amino-4-deoxychorismate lyase
MKAIFDRNFIDLKDFHLDPGDRAFQYGDGMFETIICKDGEICFLEDHLARAKDGCQSLSLMLPEYFTIGYLERQIRLLIQENQLSPSVKIKLLIWRKTGGLYEPLHQDAHHLILASDRVDQSPDVFDRVGFSTRVFNHPSLWSAFKTQSSLPYVLAGIEKKEKGLDDIILTDQEGNISELLYSNIFWIKDHAFYTPSLETGCIRGVMRTHLFRKLKELNLPLHEVKASKSILMEADFVFSANVAGLKAITGIEDQEFRLYPDLRYLLH